MRRLDQGPDLRKLALALELTGIEQREDMSATANLTFAIAAGQLKRDQVLAVINDAQGLVLKANAELLPYFHSKRPTELKVSKNVLGVMMIGDLPSEKPGDERVIDLTRAEKPT